METTKKYTTREVVGILQKEFQHIFPKEISVSTISYYRDQFKLGEKVSRFFGYSQEDINTLRKIMEDVINVHKNGYHVVEKLFLQAGKEDSSGLRGNIYYLAKEYKFGEKKQLNMKDHWIFDIKKAKKFLKNYIRPIGDVGRPRKFTFIDDKE